MKLKTIEHEGNHYAETRDGKPVYVDDSGKEHVYDAPAMRQSFDKLNNELAETKKQLEPLQEKAKAFDGLDPDEARKALDTVKNLDDKKLVDAGEVEKVKQQAIEAANKQWAEKHEDLKKRLEQTEGSYRGEKINNAFAGSKFLKERLAIPADMAQKTFGDQFKFENGRITPVDQNGNPIYSDENPGDVASFDEALEKIVSQYPYRDSIMKGSGHNGSGSQPPDGSGGKRTVSRKEFSNMRPDEQAKLAAAAREGKATITD